MHIWQRWALGTIAALVFANYAIVSLVHFGLLDLAPRSGLDRAITAAKTTAAGLPQTEIAAAGPLWSAYNAVHLDLDAVRTGEAHVPRIFLAAFPDRHATIEDVKVRKEMFISTLLPLILRTNEEIMRDRTRLAHLLGRLDRDIAIADADAIWLNDLAERYGAADPQDLVRRVDTISPALALAQAAVESGWGRSRFAREGNALYGQRTWTPGAGIVPAGIVPAGGDADFAVRSFAHMLDSVRAYAHNLNSHDAYADFRAARARQHHLGEPQPRRLAATLVVYSEKPTEYIAALRDVISGNDLAAFDDAQLMTPKTLTAGL